MSLVFVEVVKSSRSVALANKIKGESTNDSPYFLEQKMSYLYRHR